MNPKHHNPSQDGRIARAPYNFVPLPEQVVPADQPLPGHDSYEHNTGHIESTLTTESPTYTRAAQDPAFFREWGERIDTMSRDARHEYARFFSLGDAERPVIPGSTLRGMLRALVEIAGHGKVQWVTGEPLVFRAVGDTTSLGRYYRDRLLKDEGDGREFTPLAKAGFVVKRGSGWFIQPARTIGGTTFGRIKRDKLKDLQANLQPWHECKNARRIWVKVGEYKLRPVRGDFLKLRYASVDEADYQQSPGLCEAVLAYSGPMQSKQRECVVFPPDSAADAIEIDDGLVRRYREQLTLAQRTLLGPEGVLKDKQPVFYLVENGDLTFFGHGMLFRLPYQHSPADLVPATIHAPDVTDVAEAIFGYACSGTADDRGAFAGRVSVGDAVSSAGQGDVWLSANAITPAILSGPKPTTFQHYLTQRQPDPVEVRTRRGPRMELHLDHFASPPPHETVIRGHKLYWHKGPVGRDDIQDPTVAGQADTQHTQIKPVRPGVRFRFRVYFENLREFELGALLWALALPGEAGKEYRHKVGMGKPLGMGSVKIEPSLVLSDRAERYRRLFGEEGWHRGERAEPDVGRFLSAFEDYVLARMDRQERGDANSLMTVERIKTLLRMLEWPGPAATLSRYMTIEPRNEYKERPVLPDPLHLQGGSPADGQTARPRNASASSALHAPRPPLGQPGGKAGTMDRAPAMDAPGGKRAEAASVVKSLPPVGKVLKGRYLAADPDGNALFTFPDYDPDLRGVLPSGEIGRSVYRPGFDVHLEVTGPGDGKHCLQVRKADKKR